MLLTLAYSESFSVESSEDSLFPSSEVIVSGLTVCLLNLLSFLPPFLSPEYLRDDLITSSMSCMWPKLVALRIGSYSSCKLNFICKYKRQGLYYCLHQINQKLFPIMVMLE